MGSSLLHSLTAAGESEREEPTPSVAEQMTGGGKREPDRRDGVVVREREREREHSFLSATATAVSRRDKRLEAAIKVQCFTPFRACISHHNRRSDRSKRAAAHA